MSPVRLAKGIVRNAFGVWPMFELANRVTMGKALPQLKAFEDVEVARIAADLGSPPTASVACIVPTYKRPEQLLVALNSILAQGYQDFVIVVIDDGAGLPPLPRDPRIFSASLSRNSKVLGLVRNVGIRVSNSPYIAFLDDDNSWLPEHLGLVVTALEGGLDLVYTALRRRTIEGREIDILSKPFDPRSFIRVTNYVDSNSIALRRSPDAIFSRLPRVRGTSPKEDWEFVYRQMRRGALIEHIAVPTVEYLVNSQSYYTSWDGTGPRP